jgi:hypothetical protein
MGNERTKETTQAILNMSTDFSVSPPVLQFAPVFWDGVGYSRLASSFQKVVASTANATEIVAAVTGKKIRVLACSFMANGTVNVKWQSASTDLTGLAYLVANTGKVLPYSPGGWFETAVGEALNIHLSGAVAVGGELVYVLVG